MDNQEMQNDYKKLYEAEREKTEVLLSKIEESEKEIEELRFKLDRIKNSFAWKLFLIRSSLKRSSSISFSDSSILLKRTSVLSLSASYNFL